MRVLRVFGLVLLTVAVTARWANAQMCVGTPMQHISVDGSRDDQTTLTGRLGIRMGATTVALNVAKPQNPTNGSKLISYGGRLYYGVDRGSWGLCMLSGVQLGYAYLINANGLRMNAHITTRSVPVAAALGVSARMLPGVRLILYGIPQAIFRSNSTVLIGRSDTTTAHDSEPKFGFEYGAGLTLGPIRLGASRYKIEGYPSGWTVRAGVAW